MEKALKSFSIESPSIVSLMMNDGSSLRVAPADLPKYLAGEDLDRVVNAFKVRRRYFKSLPKWTAVFGFTAVITFLALNDTGRFAQQTSQGGNGTQVTATAVIPIDATSTDIQHAGSITLTTNNPQVAEGVTATTATGFQKASARIQTRTSTESAIPTQPTNSPLDPQTPQGSLVGQTTSQSVNVAQPVVNQVLAPVINPVKQIIPPGLLK